MKNSFFTFKSLHFQKFALIFISLATLITYRQVFSLGFINYDTPLYISDNLKVLSGLTISNIKWAFLTNFFSNWHPLTWMSHMLDVDIWGTNPGGHHATNLFLHILNSILIFKIFQKLTSCNWQSMMLATLFALHPLHIESVAWLAERKDVLSTFFFLLSIIAYVNYVRNQNIFRYVLIILIFSLALMSKPMVVTFPFILLLFDFWPLQRLNINSDSFSHQFILNNSPRISFLLEKIPFFLLSALCSWFTLFAQKGNIASLESISFTDRIINVFVAYLDYIALSFWPTKLAIIYPYQGSPSLEKMFFSFSLIGVATFFSVFLRKKCPWMLFGWLWFLGTLIPVIGIVQVGYQSIANRYTYIPHIGLFIIIIWSVSFIFNYFHLSKKVIVVLSIFMIIGSSLATQHELKYWENDKTLFSRALEVTKRNFIAENDLGRYFLSINNLREAENHFLKALEFNPQLNIAHTNLATLYSRKGETQKAIEHHLISLKIAPYAVETSFLSNYSLATEYEKLGNLVQSLYHYKKAIEMKPNCVPAYINVGKLSLMLNMNNQALYSFKKALSFDPNNVYALNKIEEINKINAALK